MTAVLTDYLISFQTVSRAIKNCHGHAPHLFVSSGT
jgi:hypothetical protein